MRIETKAAVALMSTDSRRVLLAGLAVFALTSCCSGNGCEDDNPNAPRISIDSPTQASTYTTAEDSVFLQGSMDPADVAVSWTVDGGIATFAHIGGGPHECYIMGWPYLCGASYYWYASVPLQVGTNVIRVTAQDGSGSRGQATISVTRIFGTPDVTPPTVSSTIPSIGASNVATNYSISATFSESMDGTTITSDTFQLRDTNGNSIVGVVAIAGNTATLDPIGPLTGLTSYTATITTGARDLAGNAIAGPFTWEFTTAVAPDKTPPSVTATSPLNASACAGTDTKVTASFSEPVSSATVNSNTFTLKDVNQNASIAGTVSKLSELSFAFTPFSALSYSSSYVATLGAGIKDLPGNATEDNFVWTFTTSPGGLGSWQATSTNYTYSSVADKRGYTAVWTGTEMILFGAVAYSYRPNSDTWASLNVLGAPEARLGYVVVWTGSRMIIWGGTRLNPSGALGDGKLYDPLTDTWQPISSLSAPAPRTGATAVWTGTEMLVWGGYGATYALEIAGGRYNPATDSWQPMSTEGAPPATYGHTAIWTGSKMIVWGGMKSVGGPASTGGVYDPVTDTWELTATSAAPSGRIGHTAVWTGTEMAIWGGDGYPGNTMTGALYGPQTKTWRPVSTTCGPAERSGHTAIWNGSEMIVWGGQPSNNSWSAYSSLLGTGARYNPTTDSWQYVSVVGAPTARSMHTAVWTGTSMIIWGGIDRQGAFAATGGRYQP